MLGKPRQQWDNSYLMGKDIIISVKRMAFCNWIHCDHFVTNLVLDKKNPVDKKKKSSSRTVIEGCGTEELITLSILTA